MLNSIFKFGKFWDIRTFFFFLILGITTALLCKQASKYDANHKQVNKTVSMGDVLYFIIFVLISFFYAFRNIAVGTDTETYVEIFLNLKSFTFEWNRFLLFKQNEILFELFTLAVRKLTSSYTFYFWLISLLIAYGYIRFFRTFWTKDTNKMFLILFVINFQYNMTALRSAMGHMFLLLSLCEIYEGKRKRAIIMTIVGSLFHYTIMVNFIFIVYQTYLMKNSKNIRKRFWIFTISIVIVFFIMLPHLSSFLLLTRYRSYIVQGRTRLISYWYVFASFLLACLELYLKENRDSRINIAIATGTFSFILIGAAVYLGAYRLVGYYALPRYYLWDRALGELPIRNKKSIIYKGIAFIAIIAYMVYTMGRNSISKGFAYRLIGF